MDVKAWLVVGCAVAWLGCGSNGGGDRDTGADAAPDAAVGPPELVSDPPAEVPVYATYQYAVECVSPSGAAVTLAVAAGDTCGGELAGAGGGSATYRFEAEPPEGATCTVALECSDGVETARQSVEVTIGPAEDVADLDFEPFEPWAEPIDDYIEAGVARFGTREFLRGVHALAVFDGRLYLGYGDANLNLGRLFPIELRSWGRPDPESLERGFATDEEQVDHYRVFGDLLIVPGVDATEDGLLGNVYTLRPGGEWYKSRTLELAWHVHDAAVIGEAIYACGSGGTLDDYNNSTVNALLFRSDDGGETFEQAVVYPHPDPPGDNRFTNLLAVDGELYVMGYFSDGEYTYAQAFTLDGGELASWSGPGRFFVLGSHSLTGDRGLLVGVEIGEPLTYGLRLVTPSGVEVPEALTGAAVIDVQPLGDGRAVVLAVEGGEYPVPSEGPWEVFAALIDEELGELGELARGTFDAMPLSIAFWLRHLYLGLSDGTVWRAEA